MLVCVDYMGIIWNCAKYIASHREGSGFIRYWYGADPHHSNTRYFRKYTELHEICSNPIVEDSRIKTE